MYTGPGNGGRAQEEGRTERTCSQDNQTQSPAAMSSIHLRRVCKQPLLFSDALEEINVYAATVGWSPQGKTPGQLPEKLGGHRDDSGRLCGRADTAVRGKCGQYYQRDPVILVVINRTKEVLVQDLVHQLRCRWKD